MCIVQGGATGNRGEETEAWVILKDENSQNFVITDLFKSFLGTYFYFYAVQTLEIMGSLYIQTPVQRNPTFYLS